ncbi:GtrA family protein [Actinoplanes sichuanensis]|uniref:GtrA family protein n=1 Tax=Actinoplanes sichuanensis TaxID=512349 RepID=A0ABW4AG32_9ACTN|nr:GtrA family protein [Actinoplanes sichuanensis]BEL11780.1 GtrA family protein [Actinoplanes sichuanensis]
MPNADTAVRIVRYGVSGVLSALTHFTVGLGASVLVGMPPVPASTIGFAASVAVSYLLQRAWVFRSGAAHTVTGPRFLTVTAAAFGLNTAILWAGTSLFGAPYPLVQAVAILLIPGLNYILNSRWTFI